MSNLTKKEKNELVLKNKDLVVYYARKFSSMCGGCVDFLDLVQAGYVGLMRASEKYDPELPTKFTTMAAPWVKKFIRETLMDKNAVHVPLGVQFKEKQEVETSHKASAKDGSKAMDYFHVGYQYKEDTYCPPVAENQLSAYLDNRKRDQANKALATLSEKEYTIIKYRADGVGPDAVSKEMGVSKQRVTQLYNKAMNKLQDEVRVELVCD